MMDIFNKKALAKAEKKITRLHKQLFIVDEVLTTNGWNYLEDDDGNFKSQLDRLTYRFESREKFIAKKLKELSNIQGLKDELQFERDKVQKLESQRKLLIEEIKGKKVRKKAAKKAKKQLEQLKAVVKAGDKFTFAGHEQWCRELGIDDKGAYIRCAGVNPFQSHLVSAFGGRSHKLRVKDLPLIKVVKK